jgi:hypothetical protein
VAVVSINHHVDQNELNALNIGSIPHQLTLEVTIRGHAPFEVAGEFTSPCDREWP